MGKSDAPSALLHLEGTPVLMCADDGRTLNGEGDALDVVAEALGHGAAWVAIPVGRFGEDFFRLRTRVAGEILQKFVTYRLRVAVIGDISAYTAGSTALQDFVRECNRGTQLWFVPDAEDLVNRLAHGRRAGR